MAKNEFHKISRSPEPKATTEFKELENYRIERTIDEGTFGKVKLGIHLLTKEKVAIKILEKSKILDSDDKDRIYREIDFLKKLKHHNIIKIYEIIENPKNYYLIMEFACGGELFNYIVRKKRLDDEDASYFFAQIINGIEYVHKNNICHRDLKPENLLMTNEKLLKIIDFGLSNSYKPNQLLQTPCGSPCYASPEMIQGKKYSGLLIDIWSIGIILYAMVCGFLPFEDQNNDKLYKKILECKLEFPNYISEMSKDLIIKILNTNPKKRIKLEEIKEHPLYKMGEKQLKKIETSHFEHSKLHQIVLETMSEIGFNKDEIIKNINAKKHNNITTTYTLFYQKFEANPSLCENKIKSMNKQLNYNVSQIGDINVNILENNNKVTGKKEPNPFKNSSATDISVIHNHDDALEERMGLKILDDDSLQDSSNKTNSKNNSKNYSQDKETVRSNNSNNQKQNEMDSPKKIIETNVNLKTKQNNYGTLKLNNLDENFNKSIEHERTPGSPPERIKDITGLKKTQANKTFKKSNVIAKENKNQADKNDNQAKTNVIEEDKSVSPKQKNNTKESKIDNLVIDFKKVAKAKNLSINEPEPTTKNANLIKSPVNSKFEKKENKVGTNTKNVQASPQSKNAQIKDQKPTTNLKNIQASPQSKNSQIKTNLKSIRSPERKGDVKEVKKTSQTLVSNDKATAMRSLSPHDKVPTSKFKEETKDAKQSQTIIIDVQDQKKDRRSSNDQNKLRSPMDKKGSININLKKETENKKLYAPTKKESVTSTTIGETDEKKKNDKKISINDSKIEVKLYSENIKKNELKTDLSDSSIKPIEKQLDKIERSSTFKKKGELQSEASEDSTNFSKSKSIGNKDEMEMLLKKSYKEFATCNITDVDDIINKITKYCYDNKIIFENIGDLKFDAKKQDIIVGVEFFEVLESFTMKIVLKEGAETGAKEIMKAILNIAL